MIPNSCSRSRQDFGPFGYNLQTLVSSATRQARISGVVLIFIAILLVPAVPCRACFSIIVGKNASVNGCVLVAHNEDDSPPQVVNHHKVSRRSHAPGAMVTLRNGGQVEQVGETWSYIWSEMPGMQFSDSYVNEWGVCVTSDNCPSREDQGELTDGGIGYMLRRLVAERARTARDGVRVAGELVERFGYVASGRTYIIADPDEGWLFCVIQGKHWLARRVGDDEVAMVANTFTVREVDLADTENVLVSKDIVTYASKRGWHKPDEDERFDFAAVYADPKSAAHPVNYGRQSIGLRYVAANPLAVGNTPPCAVVPSKSLGVADLIKVLRHNGSRLIDTVDGKEVRCDVSEAICRGSTQTSFVARLGREPVRDLGIVYWVCLSAPETSVFMPFCFGGVGFPAGFRGEAERPSQELFDQKVKAVFRPDTSQAFWTFSNFRHKAQAMSETAKAWVLSEAEKVEARAIRAIEARERTYRLHPEKSRELLHALSTEVYLEALTIMAKSQRSDALQ